MISASPLDTARSATSSCPGSPLAPVAGIGTGTVVVAACSGSTAAEVVGASPAGAAVVAGACSGSTAAAVVGASPAGAAVVAGACSGAASVANSSPAGAAVVVGATSGHAGACGNVMANVASVGLTHVQPAGSSTGGGAPCGSMAPRPAKPAGAAADPSHAYPSRTVAVTTTSVSAAGSRPGRVDRIDETRRRLELHRRRRGYTVRTRALDHRRINRQHRRACHVVEGVGECRGRVRCLGPSRWQLIGPTNPRLIQGGGHLHRLPRRVRGSTSTL